jgi:hypothetical protein
MLRGIAAYARRHHLALLALFLALGGTSFAAGNALLPKNSVGTAQLRNAAVTKQKIAKNTIKSLKGNRGPQGLPGPKGDAGPSDAYEGTQSGGFVQIGSNANAVLASVNVPVGAYVVQGSAWIYTVTINGSTDQALCTAYSADNHGVNGRSQFTVSPAGQFTNESHHEFFGTLRVSTAGPVTLHCSAFPVSMVDPADSVQAAFGDVVLIRVGSLTTNP